MKWNFLTLIPLIFILNLHLTCSTSGKRPEKDQDEIHLRKMAGQMIMAGFRGFHPHESPEIIRAIRSGVVGGVILYDWDADFKSFKRNIQSKAQLIKLIDGLKKEAPVPLWIAIDQEGGKVNRLKEKYGFPPSVSQQYLGSENNETVTRSYARISGRLLKNLGINVNFAPCADLNINPSNPVIAKYERSFSDEPEVVTTHSRWILEEYENFKVCGVLKHFPGHGSSREDSHKELTDVTGTWQETELEPYRNLIAENKVSMVMTAHLYQRHLDPDFPATLSRKILTGLLRENLGFDGIIITDDMNMKAITGYYGFEHAIELSINAGADILLYGNNLDYEPEIALKVQNTIVRLVYEGRIEKTRIEESYRRIMRIKEIYLAGTKETP